MVSEIENYNIVMFYVVNKKEDALFDEEFKQVANNNFHYQLWLSETSGRITADKMGDCLNTDIFICGPPPMMKSLTSQFNKLGVKNSRIHTEEFELY